MKKIILSFFISCLITTFVSLSLATEYSIIGLGLQGTQSSTMAINDSGQVIGLQDSQIFSYSNGDYTNISSLYGMTLGYYGVSGYDLNNSGQIVTNDSNANAVLLSDGLVTNLNTLSAPINIAMGINDSGQVVGEYWNNQHYTNAFLYSEGQMIDLGFGLSSAATAINSSGTITGWYAPQGHYQAVLFSNGGITNISPFGSQQSQGRDINNRGQIVGSFLTSDNSAEHAFLYSNGDIIDLGVLSGSSSWAHALNERGLIVGSATALVGTENWCDPEGICVDYPIYTDHAFVYNKTMIDLNDLILLNSGWVLSSAYDINERGQIVGVGFYNGEQRGFLLTPVPEPATMLLLGLGLIGLAGMGRKFKS